VAQISGPAFLAGCLASGDICWQRKDPEIGAMLEIGLNAHKGRACTTPNAWRNILKGAPLLAPTPPPARLTQKNDLPQVRVLQLNQATGQMERVPDNASLWRAR
jgi:hypothetical protein